MSLLLPPSRMDITGKRLIFLAGSIEMGKAIEWQSLVFQALDAIDPLIVVANPRRAHWDASWSQSIDNPVFKEQVNWELDHLIWADLVIFYFDPATMSPITLYELGKHLSRPDAQKSTIVCCPDGFWRKGNVDIACERVGLPPPLLTLDDLIEHVSRWARS